MKVGKKLFTAPRKTGLASFSLKHATFWVFFFFYLYLPFLRDLEQRSISPLGKNTVLVQGKETTVTCRHGGEQQGMVGTEAKWKGRAPPQGGIHHSALQIAGTWEGKTSIHRFFQL